MFFRIIKKNFIMDSKALELYLYMGSTEPIIKWLEGEKVQTRQQALDRLKPLVQSNIFSVVSNGLTINFFEHNPALFKYPLDTPNPPTKISPATPVGNIL